MLDFNELMQTALWSTQDFEGNNLYDSMYTGYQPSEEFVNKCEATMTEFMEKARHLFTDDELDYYPIEHDLWLTMHDHGAGFWDGDYENGEELSNICKQLGNLEDDLRDDVLAQFE